MSERPARYHLRTIEPSEATIQNAILRYLAMNPLIAWANRFNTGAAVVESQDANGATRRRYIRYAFPGCSDILGQLIDGRFLAVEVKAKGNKATEEQAAFLAKVAKAGGVAILAYSIDDVQTALERSSTAARKNTSAPPMEATWSTASTP